MPGPGGARDQWAGSRPEGKTEDKERAAPTAGLQCAACAGPPAALSPDHETFHPQIVAQSQSERAAGASQRLWLLANGRPLSLLLKEAWGAPCSPTPAAMASQLVVANCPNNVRVLGRCWVAGACWAVGAGLWPRLSPLRPAPAAAAAAAAAASAACRLPPLAHPSAPPPACRTWPRPTACMWRPPTRWRRCRLCSWATCEQLGGERRVAARERLVPLPVEHLCTLSNAGPAPPHTLQDLLGPAHRPDAARLHRAERRAAAGAGVTPLPPLVLHWRRLLAGSGSKQPAAACAAIQPRDCSISSSVHPTVTLLTLPAARCCPALPQIVRVSSGDTATVVQYLPPPTNFQIALLNAEVGAELGECQGGAELSLVLPPCAAGCCSRRLGSACWLALATSCAAPCGAQPCMPTLCCPAGGLCVIPRGGGEGARPGD